LSTIGHKPVKHTIIQTCFSLPFPRGTPCHPLERILKITPLHLSDRFGYHLQGIVRYGQQFLRPFYIDLDRQICNADPDAKVNLSAAEKEKHLAPRERIAEYLATSTYGCLFECYLLQQPLSECLRIDGYGRNDSKQWHNVLNSHKIFDYRKGIIQANDEYLTTLLENNSLSEFMKLNPDEFLQAYGTGYLVNVEKLRAAVSDLVDVHAAEFKKTNRTI